METKRLKVLKEIDSDSHNGEQGFTLIETAIAMVLMTIVGLGAVSLFIYAMGANSAARDRELSMAVAQQQMEVLRQAAFANLASTVTAHGGANRTVTSASRQYRVVTTITDTVTGDTTNKTITVQVTPVGSDISGLTAVQRTFGTVTLVTQRTTNSLGAHRG